MNENMYLKFLPFEVLHCLYVAMNENIFLNFFFYFACSLHNRSHSKV